MPVECGSVGEVEGGRGGVILAQGTPVELNACLSSGHELASCDVSM